ncbi:OLC1v1022023C1 [Oldenlandia corymbosa var. corymbosa]|uniref:OLC1v1022023C1 n=1 Tax=Oldenlandia corymbosa var. corymbosa TaxID=529605 RepID=A0AAV1C0N8_OLDCO|nr:OLC1v1022023C1 [Oldenlandia corymbosa var. corymbosa]
MSLALQGFRKTDPEQWEFANEDFVRGQPHLLKNIYRRKPVHSHSGQGAVHSQLTESDRQKYRDEIERLKNDKEVLHMELRRYKKEEEGLESQLKGFNDHILHLRQKQKNMISLLAGNIEKPVVVKKQMAQHDLPNKKRSLPWNTLRDEISMEITSQVSSKEDSGVTSLLAFNDNLLQQLDSSLTFWEKVLTDIGQISGKHSSSPVMDESRNCAESPAMSYTQQNVDDVDTGSKTSEIDVNCEPKTAMVAVVSASEEQVAVKPTNVTAGVNDGFWSQFLTDNPGPNDASEVQSDRKDLLGRKNESKSLDQGRYWLNMKSVNNLPEQLGHLAPAERT